MARKRQLAACNLRPAGHCSTREELEVIEEFRFRDGLPTRSAAVRELFRVGMAAADNEAANDTSEKPVISRAPYIH